MKEFEGIRQPKIEWAKNWLKEKKCSYINGQWTKGSGSETYTSINPATNEEVGTFYCLTEKDVDHAVKSAKDSFENGEWKKFTKKQIANTLCAISKLIVDHQDELATLESLDNGKLYTESYNDDMGEASTLFDYYSGWTDKVYGDVNPVEGDFLSITKRMPLGVCGLIAPFNFPLDLTCYKLAPALAAGNTIVVKPSSSTSFSLIRLVELIDEAKILPKGVLNLTLGTGEVGSFIGKHMDVNKISFTGSTQVGKELVKYSAQSNLKQVTLELGGKSPNIIFDDYKDLDGAIDRSFYGLFTHKGEKCSAPTRLFAQRKIYDYVVEKLVVYANNYVCGDPFDPDSDQGAQISEDHMNKILSYIESAKQEGATIACGGCRDTNGSNEKGFFVRPTIISNANNNMKVCKEEIFGPVLCVIPFDTEEEVIEMANDTIYGLAAGFWTDNISRAHRVADKLDAGMVFVNRYGCYDLGSPFGGVKQSGWGREYSYQGIEAYTKPKAIWFKY